ncbi:hypothetical protein BRADI_5g26941v3 [Brachypodium distachyon]|uniref:Uncharacterized protein n=1 Tax=Brachypodium distachyon TaxID=15368 RepID=A0A2K2CJJ0_BRADI|nr:hypothetical protein BRADI_5g26941v3 [Brachypodium distachyon]
MAALLGRRLRGSALQPTPVGLHFLPRLSHAHAHAQARRRSMAALVGRRLGGSVLQPTQATTRLLFFPGLIHSQIHIMDDSPASQIQQKKDELYDLLDKQKRLTCQNGRLMHNLSVQINPRPDDLRWHGFRIRKRLDYVVDAVMHSTIFILLFGAWLSWNEESSAEDGKEEALGVKNTQEQGRR